MLMKIIKKNIEEKCLYLLIVLLQISDLNITKAVEI
jgi:hypothetical protein